jgi:hypothetical protein
MRMPTHTFEQLASELSKTEVYRKVFDEFGLPILGNRGPVRKATLRREIAIAMYVLSGNEPYH